MSSNTTSPPRARGPAYVLDLPATFSMVSVRAQTGRIGVTVSRKHLTLAEADRHLCGKRLTGTLIARAGDAQAGRASPPGAEADEGMTGVFDVKNFSVTKASIRFELTFKMPPSAAALCRVAQRAGVFWVSAVEPIPETDPAAEPGTDEHEEDQF